MKSLISSALLISKRSVPTSIIDLLRIGIFGYWNHGSCGSCFAWQHHSVALKPKSGFSFKKSFIYALSIIGFSRSKSLSVFCSVVFRVRKFHYFQKRYNISWHAIYQLVKLVMYSISTHCSIFSSQVDIREKLNFGWMIMLLRNFQQQCMKLALHYSVRLSPISLSHTDVVPPANFSWSIE